MQGIIILFLFCGAKREFLKKKNLKKKLFNYFKKSKDSFCFAPTCFFTSKIDMFIRMLVLQRSFELKRIRRQFVGNVEALSCDNKKQEREQSCICVFGVSILHILIFDFEIVVLYFFRHFIVKCIILNFITCFVLLVNTFTTARK